MTSTTLADGDEHASASPAFPDRSFRALWTATGLSQVGSAVSNVTVPVCAAVTLGASPLDMTLLAAVGVLPSLLVRIPAAAWSDGLSRSRAPMMAACNLVQAAIMGLIPLLWWLGALHMVLLLVLAAAASGALAVYSALGSPLLVRIVPKAHLVEANGKMSATRSVADISGPALGGALLAVLAAPYVVLVDALSFLASAALLTRVADGKAGRSTDQDGTGQGGAVGAVKPRKQRLGAAANIRLAVALARQSGLRAAVTVAFVNGVTQPVLVLFLVRSVHMRPSLIGTLLSFGAVGGVVGGMLVGRAQKRFGAARTLALGTAMSLLSLALLPFASAGPGAMAGLVLMELGGSFGGTLLIATVFGGLQACAPNEKIAQVMAMAFVQLQAADLIGVPVGGALAIAFGTRWAMVTAFALLAVILGPQLVRWAVTRWAPDPPITV
ncbi:MFS transporter [Streptomyces beihaiensis]|uniref:MFS transporter n=1 Tax=Streptomyces beihaiensis TaxID=2984495 RepID=A0ABT3TTG8_9ACTN|nr:MFS transporter [Streptomyces beihaiensis]MCX3060306.1 MFS transporter [Streptomyces beihaiensis]